MNAKIIPLHDRSRIVTDWKCPRSGYYGYEYDGTGLQSGTAAYELYFGTLIHDALATIARFHEAGDVVPIDDISQTGFDQLYDALTKQAVDEDYAVEQAYLAAGLIRGFYKYAWPRLMESYPEIVAIEQEIVYEHDGCRFMAKPDLVVLTGDGQATYIEYKTTGWINEKWLESWETNPQLHSCMKAISNQLDVEVTGAIIQGLYKGSKYKGQTTSPFVSAYYNPGNPPFQATEIAYKWKSGLKRYPLWQIEGLDLLDWTDAMPEDILVEQFPQVPPVLYRDYLAEAFFRQSAARRKTIELGKTFLEVSAENPTETQDIMDAVWPQHFENCKPSFGFACQFNDLCHEHRGENPVDLGFKPRDPHHSTEIEEWDMK